MHSPGDTTSVKTDPHLALGCTICLEVKGAGKVNSSVYEGGPLVSDEELSMMACM